jgi:hypothetical protein
MSSCEFIRREPGGKCPYVVEFRVTVDIGKDSTSPMHVERLSCGDCARAFEDHKRLVRAVRIAPPPQPQPPPKKKAKR